MNFYGFFKATIASLFSFVLDSFRLKKNNGMHVDFDIADRVVWAQRVLARLLAHMHHMGIKLKRKEQRNMLALLWIFVAEL